MSMEAAKIPTWRKAVECSGISAMNAPTVVMLPTTKGESTSSRVCRTEVV